MRTLLCLLCLAPVAFSQGLPQGDRNRAMSELHATRKQFLDAVAGLSAAQWNFKPSETAWSVAEVAEHIALSEDFLFEFVTKKILANPAEPEKKSQVKDDAVLTWFRDRSKKVQAMETLTPKRRWPTPQAAVEHFRQIRDRTIAYIQTTPDNLRAHFAPPNPTLGQLDAYQCLLMISAHSARHVAQIEEVKAHPGFPAR